MGGVIDRYQDRLSGLNKNISLTDKIRFIHSVVRDCMGCVDRIAVVLYDPKTDLLKTFLHSSDEDHPLVQYQAKLAEAGSLLTIFRSGGTRVVNDLDIFELGQHLHTRRIAEQGFGSSYTLPMYHNGAFLGFIFFNAYEKHSFRQEVLHELDLFGHLISLLIVGELATIRMMLATVQAARQITAFRDPETGAHVDRVSRYARLIGQRLAPRYGFNDEFIEHLFLFAPLHDVGKVGLPDAVLKKAERLTAGEFEEMKEHVVIGRRIIDAILQDFGLDTLPHADMLRNIAEYHHEAVDGSGYRLGLRGEEIPIEARIIAVADIFDALTSRRRYKVAWTNQEAFRLLQQLAGFKLDRDCVAALIENEEAVLEIQAQFNEDPT